MCLLIKRPLPPTCPVLSYSLPESTAPFPPLPAAPCACCLLHWLMVHCICLVVFRRSCLCWRLWKCSWALTICTRCPSLSRVLRCSPPRRCSVAVPAWIPTIFLIIPPVVSPISIYPHLVACPHTCGTNNSFLYYIVPPGLRFDFLGHALPGSYVFRPLLLSPTSG
jgi:hypothetical protein